MVSGLKLLKPQGTDLTEAEMLKKYKTEYSTFYIGLRSYPNLYYSDKAKYYLLITYSYCSGLTEMVKSVTPSTSL